MFVLRIFMLCTFVLHIIVTVTATVSGLHVLSDSIPRGLTCLLAVSPSVPSSSSLAQQRRLHLRVRLARQRPSNVKAHHVSCRNRPGFRRQRLLCSSACLPSILCQRLRAFQSQLMLKLMSLATVAINDPMIHSVCESASIVMQRLWRPALAATGPSLALSLTEALQRPLGRLPLLERPADVLLPPLTMVISRLRSSRCKQRNRRQAGARGRSNVKNRRRPCKAQMRTTVAGGTPAASVAMMPSW